MAVDETLRETVDRTRLPVLRFYQWEPPTLSLGYFQPAVQRQSHRASAQLPLVRRPSGGGAIIHDRELTYSLAWPVDRTSRQTGTWLVRLVHQCLVDWLTGQGIEASRYTGAERAAEEPFLCFQRRAECDVIIDGHKIAGSAQRRHGGTILQHGSILVARSDAAPELPGINDLAGTSYSAEAIAEDWYPLLSRELGLNCRRDDLSDEERVRADAWVARRFATAQWTEKR